jgi:hypothetical protein
VAEEASGLERFLYELAVDPDALQAFLDDPGAATTRAGLDEDERASLTEGRDRVIEVVARIRAAREEWAADREDPDLRRMPIAIDIPLIFPHMTKPPHEPNHITKPPNEPNHITKPPEAPGGPS